MFCEDGTNWDGGILGVILVFGSLQNHIKHHKIKEPSDQSNQGVRKQVRLISWKIVICRIILNKSFRYIE